MLGCVQNDSVKPLLDKLAGRSSKLFGQKVPSCGTNTNQSRKTGVFGQPHQRCHVVTRQALKFKLMLNYRRCH